jgi:hypothetical protein
MWGWLAPASESDDSLVSRRLADLVEDRDVPAAIQDLLPLAKDFSAVFGLKGAPPLVKALATYRRDEEPLEGALKILHQLVSDNALTSQANAGSVVNENDALPNIVECLAHPKASVRGCAIILFRDLTRLELAQVKTAVAQAPRAQAVLTGLVHDRQEAIRRAILALLPDLVRGHIELQQPLGFNLIDPLAALPPAETLPTLTALLADNPVGQRHFFESGHLKILIPALQAGDEKVITLLSLLFASPDAAEFVQEAARAVQGDAGLLDWMELHTKLAEASRRNKEVGRRERKIGGRRDAIAERARGP